MNMKKYFTIIFFISLIPGFALAQLQSDKPIPLENSILAILNYLEKNYPRVCFLGYSTCGYGDKYGPGFHIELLEDSKKCRVLWFDCSSMKNIKTYKEQPCATTDRPKRDFTVGEIREIFSTMLKQLPAYYKDWIIKHELRKNKADALSAMDNSTISTLLPMKLQCLNGFSISWKDVPYGMQGQNKAMAEVSTYYSSGFRAGLGGVFLLQKDDNKWSIIETKKTTF